MVSAADEPTFLDTNVLVYASVLNSPFHQAAIHAIQALHDSGVELWISRQVLREYLSVLSRPQTFANPQPIRILAADVRHFQRSFRVAEDGPEVTERLLLLIESVPTGGSQVHDANIVATMQAYGIGRLLTANVSDFIRFTGHITVVGLGET